VGVAAARTARVAAARPAPVVEGALLATLFCVTFEKLSWNVAGSVDLADLTTAFFLAAFLVDRVGRHDWRLPRTVAVVAGFFAAFLAVYLLGFFNMETHEAVTQFGKGMVKLVLHYGLLLAGIATVVRAGERLYWRALGALTTGLLANCVYGVVQLLSARVGLNLDQKVISPLTGGASAINKYGAVGGHAVYRINALTGDPNHLGIMLVVPILILTPIYLRLERDHRLRLPLGLVLGFFLLVEAATLSRSGVLGLLAGGLVLALPYARLFVAPRLLAIYAGCLVALAAFAATRRHYVEVVVKSRIQTGGNSTNAHFAVYGFVPDVLHLHPLLGLGLNTFSLYYEFVTGKTDWGPHSFYVALVVESGLVGTLLFALFLVYVFRRVGVVLEVGRKLALAGDAAAARVRPLGWGLAAALVGTMAANVFYLTMSFYYFFALLLLALSAPLVFGRRLGDR